MADRFRTVLLFGSPGAGKGTQGKLLGAIPGFHHMATGDIFRALDRNTELGKIFFDYSSRGELVPDDVTIEVWRQHARNQINLNRFQPERQMLVLDGIPRSLIQARSLDCDVQVLKILHLTTDNQDLMLRRMQRRALKERRHDDAREDVIRHRWRVYETETFPVLSHYGKDAVVRIEANDTPARVLFNVLGQILPIHEKHFANPLED